MTKILFLLKSREASYDPDATQSGKLTTGLFHSANFVHEMLARHQIPSELQIVIDGNCIDRVVTEARPSHVIIEALWVTPAKMAELQYLHPTIKWIVRLHSEIPFIANEGIAMDWIGDYSSMKNVIIAANSTRATTEIQRYLKLKNSNWTTRAASERVIYLPNYFPSEFKKKQKSVESEFINIGCFGAVRPMKIHLTQAVAAVEFANQIGKKLRFHINASRVEQKGQPVLSNLKGLFQQVEHTGHTMIMHDWLDREPFLELCGQMDIGLQVSFSETFNIVGADLVSRGVPLVCSRELPWGVGFFCAEPTNSSQITKKLLLTYRMKKLNNLVHWHNLMSYTFNSEGVWVTYFKGEQFWDSIW